MGAGTWQVSALASTHPGRQGMAPGLRALPPPWESWTEFLTPSFDLA